MCGISVAYVRGLLHRFQLLLCWFYVLILSVYFETYASKNLKKKKRISFQLLELDLLKTLRNTRRDVEKLFLFIHYYIKFFNTLVNSDMSESLPRRLLELLSC